MSKEGTNTLVSSLSFDATHYAKARAKLGIEDPNQVAELQSADAEDHQWHPADSDARNQPDVHL